MEDLEGNGIRGGEGVWKGEKGGMGEMGWVIKGREGKGREGWRMGRDRMNF